MKIILILLSLSFLIGCKTLIGQPKLPSLRSCRIIKGDGAELKDILFCKKTDGGSWSQVIEIEDIPKIPANSDEVFTCMPLTDENKLRTHMDNLQLWINANCAKK